MQWLKLKSQSAWIRQGIILCFLITGSIVFALVIEKVSEDKKRQQHELRAQDYRKMVEVVLPPLIRQEQKVAILGQERRLDVAIKRFVANLTYFQNYLIVIVVDPISRDAVGNFHHNNFKHNRTQAIEYLDKKPDLLPMPVEVLTNNDTGQKELVGEIYMVKKSYQVRQSNLLKNFSAVFTILVLLYLLYKIKENDNLQLQNELQQEHLEHQQQQLTLIRFHAMNDALRHIVNTDFSNPLSNQSQELGNLIESTLTRIQTATQDIIHDVRKAPLLSREQEINRAFFDVKALDTQQQSQLIEKIKDYLLKAESTIKTTNWVVNNLQDLTSLKSTEVCLQQEMHDFLNHLPPVLQQLKVDFDDNNHQLTIYCNSVHLKSIVKNILYNSSAAIKKHNRELRRQRLPTKDGKILIRCLQETQTASVVIEDNGPGIPQQFLDRLYQVPERLTQSNSHLRGNGSLIVYAYTMLHGGTVKVENRAEGGARVTVSFPSTATTLPLSVE